MMVRVPRHQHAHLPGRRSGHTTTVTIGAELFCLTANQRDDGTLGEVFIHWGKRRRVAIDWFGTPAGPPELHAEQLSVETFLLDASLSC